MDAKKRQVSEPSAALDRIAAAVFDAATKVHKTLGPGLLESVYEQCLAWQLVDQGISIHQQVFVPIQYAGRSIEHALRLDLLVEDQLVVEVKACEAILPIHRAQLVTYLKLSQRQLGLLINFNVTLIKNGIHRVIVSPREKS